MRSDGGGVLAEALVGRGHDADLGDRVEAHQQLLDLLGADVLAAADDDVGDAVGDREVAVVVEHADVAGAVPPVVVEDRRGQRGVDVADEAVRAPAQDLAVLVEADLDAGQRVAVGGRAASSSGSSSRQPVIDGCSVLP